MFSSSRPFEALVLVAVSVFYVTHSFPSVFSFAPCISTNAMYTGRQAHIKTNSNMASPFALKMSDAQSEAEILKEKARKLREEVAELSGTTVEEMEADNADASEKKQSTDLYDDEVAPYKDPISENMRARLLAEASTGLDSDKKQTNVILYISIGVAILVLLGGQGILY